MCPFIIICILEQDTTTTPNILSVSGSTGTTKRDGEGAAGVVGELQVSVGVFWYPSEEIFKEERVARQHRCTEK